MSISLNTLMFCCALTVAATAQPTPSPTPEDTRARAYYHFSLAQQARLDGDIETALAEFEKARSLDPDSGQIRGELARVLRDLGRLDEAVEQARQAIGLDPDDADLRLTLAQMYQITARGEDAEEKLAAAAEQLEAAVRLRPTDLRTLLALADLYSRLERHEDAVRVWRAFLEMEDGNADAWYEIGRHLLALDRPDEAADALRRAVARGPRSSRAWQDLGDVYTRAEEFEKAAESYEKGLEVDPRNLTLRLSLAESLHRSERFEDALAQAESALQTDPKSPFALELKGRALRDLRRLDEAMAVVDEALVQDPRDPKLAYLKVTIAEARRDWAAAEATLEAVLARNRSKEAASQTASLDRIFLVHLGVAQQQQGRFADAAESFRRAIAVSAEADPALVGYRVSALMAADDFETALNEVRAARAQLPDSIELALLEAEVLRRIDDDRGAGAIAAEVAGRVSEPGDLASLAEFYQRARRFEDAEALLRRALDAQPKDVRFLFQLGAVLERMEQLDQAEAVFREALAVEPDSAPILNYLGYMNADRGVRLPEALGFIERALEIDPGNSAYLDSLGWALFRLNRLEEAEKHVRAAIEKQVGEPDVVVLDHLGDILVRRGRMAEAIEAWRGALAGEDETGDLDRREVERKLREAQSRLDAQLRHER